MYIYTQGCKYMCTFYAQGCKHMCTFYKQGCKCMCIFYTQCCKYMRIFTSKVVNTCAYFTHKVVNTYFLAWDMNILVQQESSWKYWTRIVNSLMLWLIVFLAERFYVLQKFSDEVQHSNKGRPLHFEGLEFSRIFIKFVLVSLSWTISIFYTFF